MLQPASTAALNNSARRRLARAIVIPAALVFALSYVVTVPGRGQESSTSSTLEKPSERPGSSFPLSTSEDAPDEANRDNSLGIHPFVSPEQIIGIFEQDPSLTEEFKAQLAQQLHSDGAEIDPSNISDQMLYGQIASNSRVRESAAAFLQMRGYPGFSDKNLLNAPLTGDHSPTSNAEADSGPEGAEDLDLGAGAARTTGHTYRHRSKPRFKERASASTDPPKVLHQKPPYDLQALRDLYTQIPDDTAPLRRFGSDVFVNRGFASTPGLAARATSLDVPLGPDYIVGTGDTLTINLWGGLTKTIIRTIGQDGRIFLPDAGSIQLAGLPLGKVQSLILSALKQQYRDAQVAVTVSNLRSVRVYVVGDVQRPGGYELSSLATPLSALYAAGGPTAVGSLRILLHYRGKQLVEKVDLYDFLLHGIRNGSAAFQSGDTLLVPPAGPEVAIFGAVKRPAIYELLPGETTLSAVMANAGGLTASASLRHITIERIGNNHERETITLPAENSLSLAAGRELMASFRVKDGDRIRIEPILPYSSRVVYLAGHVVRPGRVPYTDGMRLSDVLHSYQDLLPEPADRGEIIRLVPPDLHPLAIQFSISDVLIGNVNLKLQPFDTIRIFGRYQTDAPIVTIRGEVLRPGDYPMSEGMTTAQLVRMAGGFKRDALLERADLTSYDVKSGNRITEDLVSVRIGAAVSGTDPNADVPLKPGDILSIHQITNWNDIGESVTINGEVRFPGSYGFHEGERLSSVLRRAGGLLPTAYPMGAVLVREQVRDLQQQSRDELIRQIEANSAAARLSPAVAANASETLQLISAQKDEVLSQLKNHPPSGRMVIHITADIDSWANTPRDIELRRGDVLTIPKRPGFVLVTGQVYNATALTFSPGKSAEWYLSRAGGTNSSANRKEIFIIRANGSVVGRQSGTWFGGGVLSTKLDPGDVIVVPQKIIGSSIVWKSLLTAGQIAASIAITAGVAAAAL
ncbi:MAG TPA: SLBB domain-containing protein [Acidobacteriaceae bacterium]|nr:SLBB domain-containing protein [Acidobacteriaceae bacterium]